MACSNCGRDLSGRDRFCPWCGTPNPTAQEPSGADDQEEDLRQLRAAVNSMTSELAQLSLRLGDLERRRSVGAGRPGPASATPGGAEAHGEEPATPAAPAQAAAPAPQVATRQEVNALPQPSPSTASSPPGPASSGGAGTVSGSRGPAAMFADWNWEWLLGGNWLARIGIVALIFGVAFFISLAIDRGWLGETERVLLGVAAGLVFLAAGEYFRRRYAVWAQTVTGGGIAILYLAVYGAFALYALIPTELAFGSFALITLGGALLSLRHEAMGIAVLSIFGGFATPLLLQDELPDQHWLLVYVLILDAGVLALAGFRNWRWLTLLAWAGSLILFAFWRFELEPSTALSQIGITAIFLIFAAATVLFHVVRKQVAGIPDFVLLTFNAAAYFGISYALLEERFELWTGGFTACVGAFYVLLAAACRLRGPEQQRLTLFSAGIAVVFAVLAVPIQFGGAWISFAWAIEGLVLIWLSFALQMRELRWAGYVMFVVSALWLLVRDTPDALNEDLTPFLNQYMTSYAGAIVIPALAAYLLHLRRNDLGPGEDKAVAWMVLRVAIFAAAMIPVQVDGIWVAVAWAVESLAALALSTRLAIIELRWFGYGLLLAMLVRLFALDTFGVDSETFRPVANWRFLAFAVGIAALYAAGWMRFRGRMESDPSPDEPTPVAVWDQRAAFPALLALANVATLWLFSAEILASAGSDLFDLSRDAQENVSSLGLSLLWAVYAGVLIVLGVVRRLRWVRVAGLALLAVPVIKLFAYDSQTLEQEYRVIAFIALGLILLAGGLLYQRYSSAVRGFLFEE